ncbi:MAG: trimethylamine methyltransferase family protein [Deltaproteobacteria bacterium]|nr:trimethylamine methyltransferase family protein [Deltaproteobacteria bacterium]
MPDLKATGARTPVYEVLPQSDVEKIVDATFQLLRETGVAFDPEPQVLDRFSDAGCEISADHVVKFEREMVMECISTVPNSARIWNRAGTAYREIKEGVTSFIPGMTCIQVYDLETGEPRESTGEDLAMITRVADALPNIDAVCVMVKDVPNSTIRGEIGEFLTLAENTTKPLEYLCDYSVSLDAVIEMAAAIRGGMDALAEKPYFNHIITALPLYYAKTHTDQITRAAEAGIPVTMGTISIGGASAPLTVAGCMTHNLATDLAGIALSQLVRKGAFFSGTSECAMMEPATGSLGNRVPDMLADIANRQVHRQLGLTPIAGGGGGESNARRFNQDAVFEITMGMTKDFFLRRTTMDYLGSLNAGLTYSLHALLLAEDLAGMLRCLWKGIPVDDEHLALDLSRSIGPKGNYLAEPHSAKHCRENYWNSRYFGAKFPLETGTLPDADLFERIDEDLREILASHQPEPMPEPLRKQLAAILDKYDTE